MVDHCGFKKIGVLCSDVRVTLGLIATQYCVACYPEHQSVLMEYSI